MDSRIQGVPPPVGKLRTRIHRVTTAETQQFVFFSKSVFGQMIHWYGGRSHECTIDHKRCNGCERSWPQKWLGYIHCRALFSEEDVFLELTKTAVLALLRQAPLDQPLRGLQARISKTKGGAKGRYKIDLLPRRMDEAQLPQELDPREVLKFLWACKNQHLRDLD